MQRSKRCFSKSEMTGVAAVLNIFTAFGCLAGWLTDWAWETYSACGSLSCLQLHKCGEDVKRFDLPTNCARYLMRVNSHVHSFEQKIHRPEIFLSPEPELTCGTVAIIIRVVLLSPYLRIRAVSLSSIHYNQSHRVYINRRQQYISLIWN